jgi:predicted dehydrogenase
MARRAGSSPRPSPIRYAVIGLGHIAQAAVLPAFAHASRHAYLAALISGDRQKRNKLGKRYEVSGLYDYEQLADCLHQEDIQALYIATPNTLHRDFTVEAARAGVHVLCEKPLATTERDCTAMINACERAGVHLMTAYRLHFDAATLKAVETVHSGKIGDPRWMTSSFSYQIKDDGNIRLRGDLGGGALFDIGIYCINAARTLFRADPIAVHARHLPTGDKRFREVDETVAATLHFAENRHASFTCSFNAASTSWYELVGTKGSICHDSAFEYAEGSELTITVNDKSRTTPYAKRDQFAAQLVYFSRCISTGTTPEPSGREGLADVRIINALHKSITTGRVVKIPPFNDRKHPTPRQRIDRPAVPREPRLIKARAASK